MPGGGEPGPGDFFVGLGLIEFLGFGFGVLGLGFGV